VDLETVRVYRNGDGDWTFLFVLAKDKKEEEGERERERERLLEQECFISEVILCYM
jgi:ATPase subunit of ABC transporter with duplicated ATPase domains